MAVDHDLFFPTDHELDSFLEKWGKKRTKKNRLLLNKKIDEFNSIPSYSPHDRRSFIRFIKNRKIKPLLDPPVTEKKKKKSPLLSKIKKKAYEIYVQRVKDAIPGDAFTDWLQAEKEVKKEMKKK